MTRILLTRHGHVDWIALERFRGRAELALSPLGQRQAAALAKRIAQGWQAEANYTSPLSRCVGTGAAISSATQAQAQALDALTDIDYGHWQCSTATTPDASTAAPPTWPSCSRNRGSCPG